MRTSEHRILVLAPWGRDAAVISRTLGAAGLDAVATESTAAFTAAFDEGAGMAFVTEEALTPAMFSWLTQRLGAQATWSDFPLVVLSARHAATRSGAARTALEPMSSPIVVAMTRSYALSRWLRAASR